MKPTVPEKPCQGELVSYPGPWSFQLPKSAIILVNDQELIDLAADPDKVMNLATGHTPWNVSLRQICEGAKAAGCPTLIIAFDHFFSQYRPGQEMPRQLTPDKDEYVKYIATIAKFAAQFDMGLELSLLSPLEIGPAYTAQTGEAGRWVQYRKGLRDTKTGAYSVELWQQRKWANNKGFIEPEDAGVRVFAFKEDGLGGTPYRVVNPEDIIDISDTAKVEVFENITSGASRRVRVHGSGRTDIGDLGRVMVLQQYKTPEMDYFSGKAAPYLKSMLDKYLDAGVKFNAFYSDEMHIQQDWNYFGHHDHGQFTLRYVTPNLAKRFADLYGKQYEDFDKYLVYFIYGQEDFGGDVNAAAGVSHVMGSSPEKIAETVLLRSRYFKLLQDGVVDLFLGARRYAEKKTGHRIETRAHATWAESPTIDYWETGRENMNRYKYEYTPNFRWSCTVHQAAAACHDYFKWGDYLTGTGNDHPEGGYLDRNYYALALACSTGIINEIPYSYCAHWGHPAPVSHRRSALQSVYGAAGSPLFGLVQDMEHRDVEVLMLYPLDLVSAEERFGSWITQYGYANYITQAKLIELGRVSNGAIELGGRRFTTLAALFEPLPSESLLKLMEEFAGQGGRILWSGPPPVLSAEGTAILERWKALFGVEISPSDCNGRSAPGAQVVFEDALKGVATQTILTDFLVDRTYPVTPQEGVRNVARSGGRILGTLRKTPEGGTCVFLGYRPRDDQSASLGYETRNWFEILNALGAYPSTGKFADYNDNTEILSRESDYLFCRFPNGTLAFAPHLKSLEEDWPGGFSRNEEEDKAIIARLDLPSDEIHLKDFRVNGHTVTYDGHGAAAFRLDAKGGLAAFAGGKSDNITIDGRTFALGGSTFGPFAWGPASVDRRVPGGAVMAALAHGQGKLRVHVAEKTGDLEWYAQGPKPGSRGEVVPSAKEDGGYLVEISPAQSGRWIYGVPKRSE